MEEQNDQITNDKSADLSEELSVVDISDTTLEADDKATKAAKKLAKKQSKKLLTPKEKKKLLQKRALITGGVLLVALLIILMIPATRWPSLSAIGFRGNLSVIVISSASDKPIKNASVRLDDNTLKVSDEFGRVTFEQTRLGKRSVVVQKSGYGETTSEVINKTGTTKANLKLKVIGIKLDYDIKNWLTNAPIEGASVTFGEEVGSSDKTGRATIVIPPTDEKTVEVQISSPGYASKLVSSDLSIASREVSLVSSQKNYFISKRDGKFDMFSSNLDGSDQKKIIEATGKEISDVMQLSINRSNKQAVLVANRDGKVSSGRLVAGVYLIDLEKASLKKVDEGSDVQLLDWYDNSIAYTKTDPGLPYDDAALSKLQTYNASAGRLTTIMQANYFAVALQAQSKTFFVPADPYREIDNGSLTSFDLQSGSKKTYLQGVDIRLSARASYQTLELLDINSVSYELQIAQGTTRAIDRKNISNLNFALSPSSQQTAWIDLRDGQGTVLLKSIKNNDEKVIVKAGGLTVPIRFVSDDLMVARVVTSQETADYVVSVSTGKMAKVVDVSNIAATLKQGL